MSAKKSNFIRIDLPPELKVEFRELSFRRNEDMTAVLKREIAAYLDRVNWTELIQFRLEKSKSTQSQISSDPIYPNAEVFANEEKARGANSSDHIRFGLDKDEKSKLQKVCNLRGLVMSALVRLMIVRYVENGLSSPLEQSFDPSDSESNDFFGFNLSVKMDKEFKRVCNEYKISKSRVLRLLSSQYLDRVKWSDDQRPLNDDSEFPASEVKDEELEGDFKFSHVVLNKAQKNKLALVCRRRGVRASSLFRLMIARFIENPKQFRFDEQPESVSRGRTSVEFLCPTALYDLFDKACAQRMTSAPAVIKQMLLDYLGRVDWADARENNRESSDLEFPNEEIWEENSGGDRVVTIPLTRIQKKDLERICKMRFINSSSLLRVMMGRYIVSNRSFLTKV